MISSGIFLEYFGHLFFVGIVVILEVNDYFSYFGHFVGVLGGSKSILFCWFFMVIFVVLKFLRVFWVF